MQNQSNANTVQNHKAWSSGRSASQLSSSQKGMSPARKEIIGQALSYEIMDIRSYTGYKGDLIIEITSLDPVVIQRLNHMALSLNFESSITTDTLLVHKLYCISPTENTYDLK